MWRTCVGTLCILVLASAAPWVHAGVQLQPVVRGLDSPLYVTHARDGSERLFIVEQAGRIKVLQPGATVPTVFLDITANVLSGGERGLLGLAFHPSFRTNRRFFVNYTRQPDGATVVAEYRASAFNPNVADTSETILLVIAQPFANHNGGMIEFGPDGFLYIATGDGGSANDPNNRAQNPADLLGKILRIDVNRLGVSTPYGIPADNPFAGPDPGRDEVYALGLRNPFRFSFDRVTDLLYAGDVGQGAREEVDIVELGGNYGWRVFEGTLCTNNDPTLCNSTRFTPPIAEYDHSLGRCTIIGGYVYRGAIATLPAGTYIYGDLCTGEIFQLFPATNGGAQSVLLGTTLTNALSSFGEDEAGELYVVGLGGTVDRIVAEASGDTPDPTPPPLAGGGGGGGGGCFIATAAFGSPLADEVRVLRTFRDRYLLPTPPGRLAAESYYRLSPPLARWLGAHDHWRAGARAVLRPIVWWAKISLLSPAIGLLVGPGGLAGLVIVLCGLHRSRRRH